MVSFQRMEGIICWKVYEEEEYLEMEDRVMSSYSTLLMTPVSPSIALTRMPVRYVSDVQYGRGGWRFKVKTYR